MCSNVNNSTKESLIHARSSSELILKLKTLFNSISLTKKLFLGVVIFHFLIYWFLGIFLYVSLNYESIVAAKYQMLALDFRLAWIVFDSFMNNPALLYSTTFYNPFVNLPEFMFYIISWFVPCRYWFGLDIFRSLIVYDFGMFLVNLVNCFLIYKIMRNDKVQALLGKTILGNPFILMSIYMGTDLLYMEYFTGRQDISACFFLLLGLYYYVNDKEHLMYLSWGISVAFRASLVLFIIFFIFHGPLKRFVKNVTFCLLSQVPSILMFLIWPAYLPGFITNNLFLQTVSFLPTPANLMEFLYISYGIDILPSEIIILSCVLPLSVYAWIEGRHSLNVFDKMMIITLLSICLIPAYWGVHMIITLGAYLGWIASKNPGLIKSVRYLKFMLAFPFLFGLSWLGFPYYSFVFLTALIWFDFLVLFSKKMVPATLESS